VGHLDHAGQTAYKRTQGNDAGHKTFLLVQPAKFQADEDYSGYGEKV